ncbi:MAG: hypothetical protein QOI59_1710 [Gammaproteobacteria bacterium]|jgi:hypothetical protein|nr:hypothetical protein [Gammaproteobacteria bacterium]
MFRHLPSQCGHNLLGKVRSSVAFGIGIEAQHVKPQWLAGPVLVVIGVEKVGAIGIQSRVGVRIAVSHITLNVDERLR